MEHISLDGVIQHSSDDDDFPTATGLRPIGPSLAGMQSWPRMAAALMRALGSHKQCAIVRAANEQVGSFIPESVPDGTFSEQVFRVCDVVFQFRAQVAYQDAQVFTALTEFWPPEGSQQSSIS